MPNSLTYLIPTSHDGASGGWLTSIFKDASRYTVQSTSESTVVVAATAASGMTGYTVVLRGEFSYFNGEMRTQRVSTAELVTPGGVIASTYKAEMSTTISALGINQLRGDVVGSSGADTLTAGLLHFNLDGGAGDDLIRSGNYYPTPVMKGGPGADTMIGVAEHEWFISGDGGDRIDGGGGEDTVFFDEATGPVHVWLSQPAPTGQIRIDNVERLLNAPHGLIIHGGAQGDMVNGPDGPDTISGGGGDDSLSGGWGNDLVQGDEGDDQVSGYDGNDTVLGGIGKDKLWGGYGDDSANGGDGDDFIRGEDGNDYLLGGAGFDDMHGNKGEDTLYGQGGHDWVVGGQGSDQLYGDADNDLMYGNMAVDTMFGGTGQDTLRGGQEGDLMLGEDGDDWLFGDRGDDTMTGGAGADIFFVTPESGSDRITDFNSAQGDRIAFEGGERQGFTLSYEGGDTVVSWSSGAKMTLVGVTQASLGTWLLG